MDLLPRPGSLETVAQSLSTCQSHRYKNLFGLEVILCIWWNFEGVIHWEFVPNGRAVDADLYPQQLEQVHEILRCGTYDLQVQNTAQYHKMCQGSAHY